MYPKMGMRRMVDNDILYDITYQNELCSFMCENGYTAESVGESQHDIYYKAPIYNFEMHTALFSKYTPVLAQYYGNIKEKLLPVEGKQYAFKFTDEDYYIYIVAHEYKHYADGGTGLRSLLDRYVYLLKKPTLDFSYIESECEKLEIADFERESRNLCLQVLGNTELPKLSEEEKDMLENYLFSPVFGTITKRYEHRIVEFNEGSNKIDEKTKRKYIKSRLFPPIEFYKEYSPIAYKYRILIPFVWTKRLIVTLFSNGKEIKHEYDVVKKMK
jgi:hypothetical protein